MTEKHIEEFMEAVYPGGAALALASFNEQAALEDATKRILHLATQLDTAGATLAERDAEVGGLRERSEFHAECAAQAKEQTAALTEQARKKDLIHRHDIQALSENKATEMERVRRDAERLATLVSNREAEIVALKIEVSKWEAEANDALTDMDTLKGELAEARDCNADLAVKFAGVVEDINGRDAELAEARSSNAGLRADMEWSK